MEEIKKPSLLKSTMNYGAMLGMAMIIYSILLWMFDVTTNNTLSYLTYVIMIIGVILASKAFRDQEQGGSITYGRALAVGTLTSVFAGVITSFFTYILYTFIDPGLIEKTYALLEQKYYEAGMSESQIDAALDVAKRFSTPAMISFMGLLGTVLMGFIFSLIISIFIKRDGNPFITSSSTE